MFPSQCGYVLQLFLFWDRGYGQREKKFPFALTGASCIGSAAPLHLLCRFLVGKAQGPLGMISFPPAGALGSDRLAVCSSTCRCRCLPAVAPP